MQQLCTDSSIDGPTEALPSTSRQRRIPAHRNEEVDDVSTETGSEEVDGLSDASGERDSSSSAGASDLEGIPLASSAQEAGPAVTKRSKPGTAQSITEEGADSKIGIVFSRILEKKTKQGVLAVRTRAHKHMPSSLELEIVCIIGFLMDVLWCRVASRCRSEEGRTRQRRLSAVRPSSSGSN